MQKNYIVKILLRSKLHSLILMLLLILLWIKNRHYPVSYFLTYVISSYCTAVIFAQRLLKDRTNIDNDRIGLICQTDNTQFVPLRYSIENNCFHFSLCILGLCAHMRWNCWGVTGRDQQGGRFWTNCLGCCEEFSEMIISSIC